MNKYFACEVEDDANSSLEGEFEFARIMRLQVLPRAVSVYANQYFMEHENTVCGSHLTLMIRKRTSEVKTIR